MRSCSMTWLYCFLCIAWSLYEVYVINYVIFLYNFCQLSRGGKKNRVAAGAATPWYQFSYIVLSVSLYSLGITGIRQPDRPVWCGQCASLFHRRVCGRIRRFHRLLTGRHRFPVHGRSRGRRGRCRHRPGWP